MSKSESVAPAGQPTHSPKFRIAGVQVGSAKFNALADKHISAVRQFHSSQQQQVALSGQRQYKTQRRVDGGRLVYQNNGGQEEITLILDPVPSGGEEPVPVGAPWEYALIDFVFTNVSKKGVVFLAAFMSKPLTDEERSMDDDTRMPVKGVTATGFELPDKPILKFADYTDLKDQIIFESSGETDMTRSLWVDLTGFPHGLEIDIYGYTNHYHRTGGPGVDEFGNSGTVVSSTHYGSITKDYRSLDGTAWSPGTLLAVPERLFLSPDHDDADSVKELTDTFPELLSVPSETTDAEGDRVISASFNSQGGFAPFPWINADLVFAGFQDYYDTKASSVSPDDDPNAWILSTPSLAYQPDKTYEFNIDNGIVGTIDEWAPSIRKMVSVDFSVMQGPTDATAATVDVVSSVPTTLDNPSSCIIDNFYQVQYWVPTWEFAVPQPFTVKAVCAKQGNPWQVQSVKRADNGNDTWQFEVPAMFPNRPKMKDVGDGTLPIVADTDFGDAFVDFERPSKHFNSTKVGTLKIDSQTGSVKFKPV